MATHHGGEQPHPDYYDDFTSHDGADNPDLAWRLRERLQPSQTAMIIVSARENGRQLTPVEADAIESGLSDMTVRALRNNLIGQGLYPLSDDSGGYPVA